MTKHKKSPLRTERLNLMISPKLKKDIQAYAERRHKSISTLITEHFVDLLTKEKAPNVEQI